MNYFHFKKPKKEKKTRKKAKMDNNQLDLLKSEGYCVIPNVINQEEIDMYLSQYQSFVDNNDWYRKHHEANNMHGIEKQVSSFMEWGWRLKLNPKVVAVFESIWKTKNLTLALDSIIDVPEGKIRKSAYWVHTDQPIKNSKRECFQSQVNLTENRETTLVVYENSHLYHQELKNHTADKSNFVRIPEEFLNQLVNEGKIFRRAVEMNPGDMVVWDSRMFHCGQYGEVTERRLVKNVCFMPITNYSKAEAAKKLKYFQEFRQTSHWPVHIHVNGKQPRIYSVKDRANLINYDKIVPDNFSDLTFEIVEFILGKRI